MAKLDIIENIAIKIYYRVLEKLDGNIVAIPETEEAMEELTGFLKKIIANNITLTDSSRFKYNSLLSLLEYDSDYGIDGMEGYNSYLDRLASCIANDVTLYHNVVNQARVELENTVEAAIESKMGGSIADLFHIEKTAITQVMLDFIAKDFIPNELSPTTFNKLTERPAEELFSEIPGILVSQDEFVSIFEEYIRNLDTTKIIDVINNSLEDYSVIDTILSTLIYFYNDKPDDVLMYRHNFVTFINQVCYLVKQAVASYIDRFKLNISIGNLVVGYNPMDHAVVVNSELYDKYIKEGYTDQGIYGYVVSNNRVITPEITRFSYGKVTNNHNRLSDAVWEPFVNKEGLRAKLSRADLTNIYREAIVNLFNNDGILPDDLEDDLGISLPKTLMLFESPGYGINTLPSNILEDPEQCIKYIIDNYMFPMTRYSVFMNGMNKYDAMLDDDNEMDVTILSSLALMEYIVEYLKMQVDF